MTTRVTHMIGALEEGQPKTYTRYDFSEIYTLWERIDFVARKQPRDLLVFSEKNKLKAAIITAGLIRDVFGEASHLVYYDETKQLLYVHYGPSEGRIPNVKALIAEALVRYSRNEWPNGPRDKWNNQLLE